MPRLDPGRPTAAAGDESRSHGTLSGGPGGGVQVDVVEGEALAALASWDKPGDGAVAGIAIAAVACESGSSGPIAFTLEVSPLPGVFSDAPHSAQKRLMLLFGESHTGQMRGEAAEVMVFSLLKGWT